MQGQAAIGLLTAVVLFGCYWVAAGPGGFALLKHYRHVRHSWLFFVVMAAVFTGIAWGGVSLIGSGHEGIKHLTVLDTIYRPAGEERRDEPQFQYASGWFSVGVSNYGRTRVSLASEKGQRDLLTSWAAPGSQQAGYPDVDRYEVPLSNAADFSIPARATESQLYGRWAGALDPKWGELPRADPADPIRVEFDPRTEMISIKGTLVHQLPGDLTDVLIIHVNPVRRPLQAYRDINSVLPTLSAALPNYGRTSKVPIWRAGQRLDLMTTVYDKGPMPAQIRISPMDSRSSPIATRIRSDSIWQ